MKRPDLAFDVNLIASEVSKATLKTVKNINYIIKKAKKKMKS